MNEQQFLDQPQSTKKLCYVCKYVDGTFKVVSEPFRQLFCIRAFVKRDGQLKQVPLAFVLMTSRRRVDYVYAFCNRCSTHCRNLRQFRHCLRLRSGTPVGRQRRLSWRRSAWARVPFLTGRVEERPVGRPAVVVRQRRRHQPRLPQDSDAIVSCRQI